MHLYLSASYPTSSAGMRVSIRNVASTPQTRTILSKIRYIDTTVVYCGLTSAVKLAVKPTNIIDKHRQT